jgi:hypothetical protein
MIDLYKLEYTTAATRYENIFKALWQNFNYLAVLAAAILTFGRDTLGLPMASLLAASLLILWYWSNFEPLNRYGDKTELRLRKIEKLLTVLGMQPLANRTLPVEEDFGLLHFSDYGARVTDCTPKKSPCFRWITCLLLVVLIGVVIWALEKLTLRAVSWGIALLVTGALLAFVAVRSWEDFVAKLRVRNVIRAFAMVLHLFVFSMLIIAGPSWKFDTEAPKPPQTQPIQIIDSRVDATLSRPATPPTNTNSGAK